MKTKEIINHAISEKVSTFIYYFGTLIIGATTQIFSIIIIQDLVDRVFITPTGSVDGFGLSTMVTFFVLALIVNFSMNLLSKHFAYSLGTKVTTTLSKAAYSTALRAELADVNKFNKEELLESITKDASYIGEVYIAKNWYLFTRNTVYLLSFFITMMILNPILGLISFVTLPLFYMAVRSYDKLYYKFATKAAKSSEKRVEVIQEDLSNIKTIKLRNGIDFSEEKIIAYNNKYRKTQQSQAAMNEIKELRLFDIILGTVLAVLIGIGGYQSTRGDAIVGTIVAFMLMTPIIYTLLKQLMYNNILPSFISEELKSLDKIFNVRSEFRAEPINSLDEIKTLKFENVFYEYYNVRLENISFDLKSGEKLAVLFVDNNNDKAMFELITKLAKPKDGFIVINNIDYNRLNTQFIRSIFTVVSKERDVFSNTIQNNIIFPLAFDEYKYNDALNKSGLKDMLAFMEERDQTFIKNDDSLNNELRHRIVYANAFYKDSKIFVINEIESSLDPRIEESITKEIFELKNKITIILTDRNYSALKCDKVLVLGKNEVLEYGKVTELLNNKASLFNTLIKKVKSTKSAKSS